jgi:metal-responsive CopG/Arc/MetJ family transcriptional regulator
MRILGNFWDSVKLHWYNESITSVILFVMKTAVSLPDDLFRMAETAARKLKMSRSQFYAAALSEFLERRESRKITARLNDIYSKEPAKVDSALISAQLQSIDRESW